MLPLPRIRITDLLSEVARWTFFTDRFIRLRTVKLSATWSSPPELDRRTPSFRESLASSAE
jgi:hypothetical protein